MVYLKSKKNVKDSSILVQGTNITDDGNTFSLENYDNFLKQYENKLNEKKYDLESIRKRSNVRNSGVPNATGKDASKMPSIGQNKSQAGQHGHASSKGVSSAKTKLRQEHQQMSSQNKKITLPSILTSTNIYGDAKSPPDVGTRRFNQNSAQMNNNTGQKSL